jgi:hypothetical protein
MKKIYLMLGAVLAGYAAQGQSLVNENEVLPLSKHEVIATETTKKPVQKPIEKTQVLWSNSFDNASDWILTDQSPAQYGWVITTNANAMPNAAPSLFPFASPTLNNGYALIDSDGSPWQGDGTGRVVGQIRNATAIDLTGEPYVMLRYLNNYRWWQDTRGVRVSGDNGSTWTTFYLTDNGNNVPGLTYPNNQNSENPDVVELNISGVAGGQSQVLVEFFYDDNNIWGWYWAIDDVEIVRLPENDISVNVVWPGDILNDYDYSMIPQAQVSAMTVGAELANRGYATQTNVPVTLTITRGGTTVHTQTINRTFVADPVAFLADTVWFNTTFVPTTLGVYEVSISVPADDVVANNTASASTETTQYIWAHDYLDGGIYRFDRDDESTMGITFVANANQTMYGLDVAFGSSTTEAGVFAELWDVTGVSVQAGTLVTEVYYAFEPGDLAGGVITTIKFDNPEQIIAGNRYMTQVRKEAGPTRLFIEGSDAGDDDLGTVCFGPFGTGGAVNFYVGWGFSPAVRANFDISLSVENNSMLSIGNVYPNPAQDYIMIPMEDAQIGVASLLDLSGKVIATQEVNGLTNFSTAGVANGVYILKVDTAEGIATQKVVIQK